MCLYFHLWCLIFLKIFLMWAIFKVFIDFVTILCLFVFCFFWPQGTWNLSSRTGNRTHVPCIGRWSLNHQIAREVSLLLYFDTIFLWICVQEAVSHSYWEYGPWSQPAQGQTPTCHCVTVRLTLIGPTGLLHASHHKSPTYIATGTLHEKLQGNYSI